MQTAALASLLHCRSRGYDRGAAGLALGQAGAEALIAGATKIDANRFVKVALCRSTGATVPVRGDSQSLQPASILSGKAVIQ